MNNITVESKWRPKEFFIIRKENSRSEEQEVPSLIIDFRSTQQWTVAWTHNRLVWIRRGNVRIAFPVHDFIESFEEWKK